jgi:hypothetical protein
MFPDKLEHDLLAQSSIIRDERILSTDYLTRNLEVLLQNVKRFAHRNEISGEMEQISTTVVSHGVSYCIPLSHYIKMIYKPAHSENNGKRE